MPFALIIAFAVSLGGHALALFGTDLELSTTHEPPRLLAELLPPPVPPIPPVRQPAPPEPKVTARPKLSPPKIAPQASASPVLSTPALSETATPTAPVVERPRRP